MVISYHCVHCTTVYDCAKKHHKLQMHSEEEEPAKVEEVDVKVDRGYQETILLRGSTEQYLDQEELATEDREIRRESRAKTTDSAPRNRATSKDSRRKAAGTSHSEGGPHGKEKKRRMIRNYEVLRFLGRGCQGVVFKCKNTITGEIVAIKTIKGGSIEFVLQNNGVHGGRRRKYGNSNSSVSKNVSSEIALLKKVDHPNLVKLLTVIDSPTDRDIHLVFEFCSGGPLRQLSDNKLMHGAGLPLPEDETKIYFRQLCSAIRYLHYHGIVHRDIKPSNLIIDRVEKILKLSDLGIASQTSQTKASRLLGNDDELPASTMIVGTPAFLPPEYYERMKLERMNQEWLTSVDYEQDGVTTFDPNDSFRAPPQQYFPGRCADIWAAGTTLYAMIYGTLPVIEDRRYATSSSGSIFKLTRNSFSSSSQSNEESASRSAKYRTVLPPLTQEEMREAIVNLRLRFPGTGLGTSMRLRNLLTKMLEKDPALRLTIDEICNHEWLTKNHGPVGLLSVPQQASIKPTKSDESAAIVRKPQLILKIQEGLRSLRFKGHLLTTMFRTRSSKHSCDSSDDENDEDYAFDESFASLNHG